VREAEKIDGENYRKIPVGSLGIKQPHLEVSIISGASSFFISSDE